MRESGGSSTGHNRETTGRANDYPFTQGRSPAPPPLTDHTQGRSPAPPHPPEGASKARQIEPVSLPGQGPPAAG